MFVAKPWAGRRFLHNAFAFQNAFVAEHNRSARDLGYAPLPTMDHAAACRQAFAAVRRDVWHERESRLRATWESYG